jgi:Raf kinase inhibitor-like YbhB/YbcL family protein
MKLTSSAFKQGDMIPSKYTKDGPNVNPPLVWDEIPEGTESLALIVDDPDAPVGLWVHWLVCDISPEIAKIAENSVPQGAKQVKNDFGFVKYGGPAPPSGTHRYFFKLYAMNVPTLDDISEKDGFYAAMEEHQIEKAELMGKYARRKK